jgi:hypothetical protein
MITVFPSTSFIYFQVSSAIEARLQYLLNLATAEDPSRRPARGGFAAGVVIL